MILKNFHLNPGTGGRGQYNGGDGVIRELLFRKTLALSVLTERRVFSPYGLAGEVLVFFFRIGIFSHNSSLSGICCCMNLLFYCLVGALRQPCSCGETLNI